MPQNKIIELAGRKRVRDIVASLRITPGTVMVIRGDTLLTDTDVVEADEEIEIRSVISGGAPSPS